jgi:NADH-quinone oxidoreductase subunit N
LVLVLAGLGFKIAAVPFHFYAPDVYQGATPVNAGLLAVAPKLAGILAMIRLLTGALPQRADFAWQLAMMLAMLTMTLGNVCALWQQNVRRLMAYSSIAHAGYLLMGVSVGLWGAARGVSAGGVAATLVYLTVYALAALGTFAALAVLSDEERELNLVEGLSGLSRARPVVAGALAVCMFSLAGIPPLAGFWGKLSLLGSALRAASAAANGSEAVWFTALAVVGALNAAVAAAYYLRVIAVMYFRAPQQSWPQAAGIGPVAAMLICAALVLAIGLAPRETLRASQRSEQGLPRWRAAAAARGPSELGRADTPDLEPRR